MFHGGCDSCQELLTRAAGVLFGVQKCELRFGEFAAFEISGQAVETARDVAQVKTERRGQNVFVGDTRAMRLQIFPRLFQRTQDRRDQRVHIFQRTTEPGLGRHSGVTERVSLPT